MFGDESDSFHGGWTKAGSKGRRGERYADAALTETHLWRRPCKGANDDT